MLLIQWFFPMSMTLRSFSDMTAELRIWIIWSKRRWMRNQIVGMIDYECLWQVKWVNLLRFWFILTFVERRMICWDWFLFFIFKTFLLFAYLYRLIFLHFWRFWQFLFWRTYISILKFYNRLLQYFNLQLWEVTWRVQGQQLFLTELLAFWMFFEMKECFYNYLYCIDWSHYFESSYFLNFRYPFFRITRFSFFEPLRTWWVCFWNEGSLKKKL